MVIYVFFTGLCTVLAGVAVYSALKTLGAADDVAHAERRVLLKLAEIAATSTRLAALEAKHDSLLSQVRKLSGRFYQARELGPSPAPLPPREVAARAAPICPNWERSKVDGPGSDSAACKCDFCADMRERRAAARALDLLKRNGARHDADTNHE